MPTHDLPTNCQPGAPLPPHAVFRDLRDRWVAKRKGRSSRALADHLTECLGRPILPQRVSQWASGSDPARGPSWDAVLLLADELGLAVRVTADSAELCRKPRRRT